LVTAVIPVLAEHHSDRDDQQDDAASDAQGARREVQQPGEQAAENQEQRGDHGGSGQHFAQDPPLGVFGHIRGHIKERHERDLGSDADQEQQERVDDEGSVERFEFLHPGPVR
jgi:hypothetical protein